MVFGDQLISRTRRIGPPAKRHCCHPICFHWQKRLQQEKHECWFFSMCIPDLWKQSLFSHSPAERLSAAGNGCLFNCLSHTLCSTSQGPFTIQLPLYADGLRGYFWIHYIHAAWIWPEDLILEELRGEICSFDKIIKDSLNIWFYFVFAEMNKIKKNL